jgi:DNA (cytosine-5)-methyltransferase 1
MQSITGETAATLNASSGDSPTHSGPSCICFEPGSASRVGGHVYEDDASGSLRANAGDNAQAVCYGISAYNSNSMKSPNPHSGVYEADTSRTLDLNGGSPACNQGGIAVVSYGLDRASFNQGKNAKFSFSVDEELAPSLVAKGPGGGFAR